MPPKNMLMYGMPFDRIRFPRYRTHTHKHSSCSTSISTSYSGIIFREMAFSVHVHVCTLGTCVSLFLWGYKWASPHMKCVLRKYAECLEHEENPRFLPHLAYVFPTKV